MDRHRAYQPDRVVAVLDTAPRDAQAPAGPADHRNRRPHQSARRKGDVSRQFDLSDSRHQQQRSIGRASSSGCFRLTNAHVTHLATLAKVGTTVRVVSSYSGVSTSAPLSSLFSGFGSGDESPPKKRKAN